MTFPLSRIRRRFNRSERGAILVLAVPALLMAIVAAALGVDIGREAVDKRFDQKVADLAALDAARAIDGILGTTNQAGYDAAAQAEAVESAARNGFVVGVNSRAITAVVGHLDPTTNAFSTPGADAVQVVTSSHINNTFLPGGWDPTATAVARIAGGQVGTTTTTTPGGTTTTTPGGTTTTTSPNSCPHPATINCPAIGEFSVASSLASLDTSKTFLDPILKALFGTSGSFSAVSYSGLAAANVRLVDLQDQLVALGYNVASAGQLMSTDVKVVDLLRATASALQVEGFNVAATEINDMPLASISSALTMQLGDLMSLGSPADSSMLGSEFNVWQLVMGSAELVNGAHFVSIPLTGVNLLGLSGVTLSAYAIEPAQTAAGPIGTTAHNAQIALKVTVNVSVAGLISPVAVTLTYTAAEATSMLQHITCGAAPSVTIDTQSGGSNVTGSATIPLGAFTIAGTVAPSSSTDVLFSYPSQFAPTYTATVGQTDSGLAPFASLTVTGTGTGSAFAVPLQNALSTVLTTLDQALQPLIKPVLTALGMNVASADVAALNIYPAPTQCGNPVLAK